MQIYVGRYRKNSAVRGGPPFKRHKRRKMRSILR